MFFGSLNKLGVGDSVFITDFKTNKKLEYKIYEKFLTQESNTDFYERNTDGKCEISLVTCKTNDNNQRLILLAREK